MGCHQDEATGMDVTGMGCHQDRLVIHEDECHHRGASAMG